MTAGRIQRNEPFKASNTFRPYRGLNVNVFCEYVQRVQEAEYVRNRRQCGEKQ